MHCHWLLLILADQFTGLFGECGVPVGQTKIVGGVDVPSLRYPWYVALVSLSNPQGAELSVSCGGSLVTDRHVVTAAHCFPTSLGIRPERLYRAVFLLVNRCEQTDAPSSRIKRVDIYPTFNTDTLHGDIAIVTLYQSVNYTPICLPQKGSVVTGGALIIGFGSSLTRSIYPCVLQEAAVNIFSKRRCMRTDLNPEYARLPGTFCAGVLRGGVDTCDGDSGGPLDSVGSDGVHTLRGIVSFGEGCARKNLPGVYTQVSAYIDFIEHVLQRRKRYSGKAPLCYFNSAHFDLRCHQ